MTHFGGLSGEHLRAFIQRVENLESEKENILADIRDVYAEAKAVGFAPKVMRELVKLRKKEASEREEHEAILDIYMHALGMIDSEKS